MFGTFRFVLAHLVVLGHLWPSMGFHSHVYAVFCFYLLSGYLMALVLSRVYGFSPRGTARFLINRALRIYPPYLVAAGGALVALAAVPQAVMRTSVFMRPPEDLVGWLQNLVLFGVQGDLQRLVPPSWSLDVELRFYVAMGLLLARWRALVFVWLAASVLYTLYLVAGDTIFADRYTPVWAASLPFSLGASLYHLRDRLPRIRAWSALPLGALFLLHALAASWLWPDPAREGFYGSLLLGAALVAVLLQIDKERLPAWLVAADRLLGDLSYPIFLCHWLVAVLVGAAFGWDVHRGPQVYLVSAVAVNAVAWGIHRAVERPIEARRAAVRARAREAGPAGGGPPRWRRALFPLAAAALALAAVLGLAELGLRIGRPDQVSRIVYPCIYEPDQRFGYRYRPGAVGRSAGHFEIDNPVRINSLGFYDAEPLPPGASSLRVLAVGDSFTAALNVPRDEVWTAVLERELRARGEASADVVNLGMDGTGTDVHVDLLRAYLPRFEPELVVLAFYGNDFLDVLNGRFARECHRGYVLSWPTREALPDPAPAPPEAFRDALRARVDAHLERGAARWLDEHLFFARALRFVSDGPVNPFRVNFVQTGLREMGLDDETRSARTPRIAAALRGLGALARGCGCRLVVAPVPPRRELEGSLRVFRKGQPRSEAAFEVLDVVPAMRRMLAAEGRDASALYFEHDDHLDAYGNRLYALALLEALGPSPSTAR